MHEDDGRWGTVSDAAQVFEVPVDTVRRRMKRGELEARHEQTAGLPMADPSPR